MGTVDIAGATATGSAPWRGWLLALSLITLTGCGGAAARPPSIPSISPPPYARPVPSAPSTSSPPVATPASPTAFTGTISASPGAIVRFGPGMEMPGVDIEPEGRAEVFDGWVRRPDDPPQADAVTGRVEWWSHDWFRLADGRGWVHSALVRGFQPQGMAPGAWIRPAGLPAPTAELLDIPIDLQDQPVTCEVAALKMALRFRGIRTDERSLLALTGVDDRLPELGPDGGILRWGNPDTSFVGSPAGHIFDRTGYGVYAPPIARAAAAAGGTVLASGTDIGPPAVYAAVLAGRPVMAWVTGDYQQAPLDTWRAWDGTQVRYALTEHAVLVIGVTPTSVVLDDPWWGQLWRTRQRFEAAYATFDHMAVMIG